MSRFSPAHALGAVLLVVCSASATAQVTVYDNFGAGNGGFDYNWGLGWTVSGDDVPAQYGVQQAMAFTPTTSGYLSDVWVAMWYVPLDAQADEVTLRLTRNPNGQPPELGDVMEEWTITSFASWSAWSPPHHLVGGGTSYLQAGESYWLWAVGGNTTWAGWCMNEVPSFTCPHTMRREGENWLPVANETASAFRVDVFPAPGVAFCFGDSGSGTPCPCNNDNDGSVPGSGCDNGAFASGGHLAATGEASLSNDTVVLIANHLEPLNSGLYFQAENDLSPGVAWGDGLRCAGGSLKRLQVRFADAAGSSSTTLSISGEAGNIQPGDTKHYQCWYRTSNNPPCGIGVNDFNATNGYSITWQI